MKRGLVILTAVGGALAAGAAIVAVVRLGLSERDAPSRCGAGLVSTGERCCAPGQTATGGRCVGAPTRCPASFHADPAGRGCVVEVRLVSIAGGHLALDAEDWQSEGMAPRTADVAPFSIDATEVTEERWERCVYAGACPERATGEPGLPVTDVDARTAERFCRSEHGRLPTSDEWLLAATGGQRRRFPWGPTGLVCRRATYGMESGPCARSGGPELVGARPDGASPEGVLDLVGNVAEWTTEPDGTHVARGGSFRSTAAQDLRSWSAESPQGAAPHVGFRCVHDAPGR